MPRRTALAGVTLSAWAGNARAQPVTPLAALPPAGNRLPEGFVVARTGGGRPGRWEVVEDASATGGRAVAQVDADPTSYRFPLLIWSGLSAADVNVSVRFKAITGRVDQAGGLAVRLTDANNYLIVRANALENNVRLYRVVRGDRQQIAGTDLQVSLGEWHTLVLRAEGDRLTVTFNGRELFTARDRAILGPGRVALWTKADSVTHFEALAVRSLT